MARFNDLPLEIKLTILKHCLPKSRSWDSPYHVGRSPFAVMSAPYNTFQTVLSCPLLQVDWQMREGGRAYLMHAKRWTVHEHHLRAALSFCSILGTKLSRIHIAARLVPSWHRSETVQAALHPARAVRPPLQLENLIEALPLLRDEHALRELSIDFNWYGGTSSISFGRMWRHGQSKCLAAIDIINSWPQPLSVRLTWLVVERYMELSETARLFELLGKTMSVAVQPIENGLVRLEARGKVGGAAEIAS